ncbi:hypothetical protein F441_12147 [Phytophthora nicotianae CJ01A1]|uniref:ABC transporter domain-containing protein n=1 Tax=Phytophthora nicotianae CJ01A1 TaxID=1317063 RepID=W2WQ73_PHYNI|nr:hypothetical protein F441_12147 [Phytophthora nicotianae CJ01A1]
MDGVDINKLTLHDLSSNIALIQQDPVLFLGTKAITSLHDSVDEKGSNFSVDERQLVFIARALLMRSKVVLMDEATTSIDLEKDHR